MGRLKPAGVDRRHGLRSGGFSLIEILVVVVILGAVIGAATLAYRGHEGRWLDEAAQRTRALMQLACERASLTGVDLGMRLETSGLQFGYLRGEQWHPIASQSADELRPRPWPDGVQASGYLDGLLIDPEREPQRPHWACYASGESSTIRIELRHAALSEGWRLQSLPDGRFDLEREGQDAR